MGNNFKMGLTTTQQIHHPSEGSGGVNSTVLGGAQHHFLLKWLVLRQDGPGAEPLEKDFGAWRASASEMGAGDGNGSGWRVNVSMFILHLIQDLRGDVGEPHQI